MRFTYLSLLLLTGLFIFGCGSNNSTTSESNDTGDTSAPAEEALDYQTPFSKTLEMNGLSFKISAPNEEGKNLVAIQPTGLSNGDEPAGYELKGKVLDAQIVDMDDDKYPEIIIIARIDGPSKQGLVIGYTVENGERLSEIYFPSVINDTYYSNGYLGGDEISLIGKYLIQKFPVHKPSDTRGNPTGGSRQLQYGLFEEDGKKRLDVVSVTDQQE